MSTERWVTSVAQYSNELSVCAGKKPVEGGRGQMEELLFHMCEISSG